MCFYTQCRTYANFILKMTRYHMKRDCMVADFSGKTDEMYFDLAFLHNHLLCPKSILRGLEVYTRVEIKLFDQL